MPEVNLNPTEYVEPVLRFNRTCNPVLTRWRSDYAEETDWVRAMSVGLAATPMRLGLTPYIIASFEQMSMESDFPFPQRPYNNDRIPFSTKEYMYLPRTFHYGQSWSLTYVTVKEFMMSDISSGLA